MVLFFMRQEYRLDWRRNQRLGDYQVKKQGSFERRLKFGSLDPYEINAYEAGWMFIEWTSTIGGFAEIERRLKGDVAKEIVDALKEEGSVMFDYHPLLTKRSDFPGCIFPMFREMNPRMKEFLEMFKGRNLLLDNASPTSYGGNHFEVGSVDEERGDRVCWFLARPNRG